MKVNFFFLFYLIISENANQFKDDETRFNTKKRKICTIEDDDDDVIELETVLPTSKTSKSFNKKHF